MLDRFPAEILDEILLLANTPSTPTSPEHLAGKLEGFSASYWVLFDCCKVSKKVLARAQPLLWRNLVLHPFPSHTQVYGLISKKPRGPILASFVRLVVVRSVSANLVNAVLRETKKVEELLLDGRGVSGEFDLKPLRSLANLANIVLVEVELAPLLHPFRLNTVTCLVIIGATIPATKLSILLSQCLPSLRNLGIDYCYERHNHQGIYAPSIPSTVLDRLHVLQYWDSRLYSTAAAKSTRSIPNLCTIDSAPKGAGFTKPAHIRYIPTFEQTIALADDERASDVLNTLLALQGMALDPRYRTPPLSLHLPSFFRPGHPAEIRATRGYIADLRRSYADAHTDVVWHDDGQDDFYGISPHFVRYAKELKAKKEAAQLPSIMLDRFPAEILDEILLLASKPSPPTSPEQVKDDLDRFSNFRLSLLYACTVCKKMQTNAISLPYLFRRSGSSSVSTVTCRSTVTAICGRLNESWKAFVRSVPS